MAKEKSSKAVQNKHIYSRASYLYQTAAYLTAQSNHSQDENQLPSTSSSSSSVEHKASSDIVEPVASLPNNTGPLTTATSPLSTAIPVKSVYGSGPHGGQRQLITHLRSICRKTQTRLSQDIKRSLCKRCDMLLVPGRTCSASMENASRGGKKERADVYTVRCRGCGTVKRFPVGMTRQRSKRERVNIAEVKEGNVQGGSKEDVKRTGEESRDLQKRCDAGAVTNVPEHGGEKVGVVDNAAEA